MSAEPQQAAREVISGEPSTAARKWLGPTALVMFILFALDTYLVTAGVLTRPFDIPITTFVQSIDFGPVTYVLQLINASAGMAALLIAVGWLSFLVSVRPISDGVFNPVSSKAAGRQAQPGPSQSAMRRTFQGP